MKRGLSHAKGVPASAEPFDWDRLRIFRAVAHTGSMSAAAALLGGSLPTISRRITDLEIALHAELFQRHHTGVNLTRAGLTLLRHADLMADAVKAAQDEMAFTASNGESHLQLVCSEALAQYWIAPRLGAFQLDNPDLIIDLIISDTDSGLREYAADISIQHSRPTEPDLVIQRLGRSHHAGFVSQSRHAETAPPASSDDLAIRKALIHSPYMKWLADGGGSVPEFATMRPMNSMAAIVSCCSPNVAPAILPTHILDSSDELTLCQGTHMPALDIWLCHTPRLRKLKNATRLLEWLNDLFSPQQSDWFRQLDITRQ